MGVGVVRDGKRTSTTTRVEVTILVTEYHVRGKWNLIMIWDH